MNRSTWTILLFMTALPSPAPALVGDTDEAFGIDGSIRNISAATFNYDFAPLFGAGNAGDGMNQMLLRLTAGGAPVEWLSYEVHGVQSLSYSTMSGALTEGSGLFSFGGSASRYQALDAGWAWADEDDIQARLWLDRCNLKFVLPFADVTVGRQAVTFGKAYFWNPLDVFLAFDPRQFDRDYKAGVDALRIDIPLGDFSGINLVGVLGRELSVLGTYEDDGRVNASWHGSAILARVFTNLWEWDLALQGGKIYGGYQVGGAASGELGPLAIRAEMAYFIAEDPDDLPFLSGVKEMASHVTVVLGIGHRFENTLDIQAEYLFNGSGDPDNLQAAMLRMASGGSFHLGRHLLGLVATYEILPILHGSLAWIFSFSDLSSLVQPGLSLSISDEADLLVGALLGLGARPTGTSQLDYGLQSEFGTYPNFYYLEFKYYF